MGVRRFIFKGYGPENDALVEDVSQKITTVVITREPILEEYQADGFMEITIGANEGVYGLFYKEEQPDRKRYLKFEKYMKGGYYCYTPRRNTKEGKALAEKLKAPNMYFNYSKYIIEQIGIHPDWVFVVGDAVYVTVAYITKGHIVLSIPYDEETNRDIRSSIPDWLEEVDEPF